MIWADVSVTPHPYCHSMNPSEIGERTEIKVIGALVHAGVSVVVPFGPYHRYDLAFEYEERLVKVQCKTGREKNGVIGFWACNSTRAGKRRDYRGDADLFGVYCPERDEVYLVPVADSPTRFAHLRVEPPRNNQKAGIREAARYLVRDGHLPDAVVQALTPAGNSPARTRGNRPSRITSSLARRIDRQLSMFECTLASTDVDIGEDMAIPVVLPEDRMPVACCSPLAAPKLDEGAAEATASLFKALGDAHRVRIVNLLLANPSDPVCVCDITAYLRLSQSTVSFHLKKLVNAGLLDREQRGTWAYYSINPDAMRTLRDVVDAKGVTV